MGKDTPKKPEAKSTPLEGMSTEQLLAMLKPIQHERASTLSARLLHASTEIQKIAETLKSRASSNLQWSGAGFESFVEWSGATASATFRLADFAREAAKALGSSSEAMAIARNGVDEIEASSASAKADYMTAQKTLNAARHDPGAGKTEVKSATDDMNAAATLRERLRVEALMKLHSLGQTYTFEGSRVNSMERPVFPPPAGYLGDAWKAPDGYAQLPGGSSETYRSTSSGSPQTGDRIGVRSEGVTADSGDVRGADPRPVGTVEPGGPARPGPTRGVPEVPADLGIDSVVLPDTPTVPTVPTGPGPVRPEGPAHPGVNPLVPPTFGNGPVGLPSQLPITGGTTRGLPPLRPGPVGPGGRPLVPRMPGEPGIVGGRPVPPTTGGRPATGLPRSTVVGNERPYGRPATGGTAGPHMGGGGGAGGGQGAAAGRRLASESGGVVGGRPQQNGRAAGRPFTPGGSGLVRGGQNRPGAGGPPVVGGRPAGNGTGDERREERGGRRPDYLVEDEETWQQGRKKPVVPPVVD